MAYEAPFGEVDAATLEYASRLLAEFRAVRDLYRAKGSGVMATGVVSWHAVPDPGGVPFGAAMRVTDGTRTGVIRTWVQSDDRCSADASPEVVRGVLVRWDGDDEAANLEVIEGRALNSLGVVI